MSRLSFRPRPLDIHKKLPIVKSIKDLDIEDGSVGRASHAASASLDGDCENLVSF
jgi:enhancer of polycomb-like protein